VKFDEDSKGLSLLVPGTSACALGIEVRIVRDARRNIDVPLIR
jgi:hypothetical protein